MKCKKFLSLCFMTLAAIAICVFALSTEASAETDGIYSFTVDDGKATYVYVNKPVSGELEIPATLGGYPVVSIGGRAFENCDKLTSVTIPDGVTIIKGGAFSNCTSLTSVKIPDSVISIGSGAFSDCTSLESITIPDSVTNLGSHLFQFCDNLKSVKLPNKITSIGEKTFSFCIKLRSVKIPDSVKSIGSEAFSFCTRMTSIVIPEGVTSIGKYAFSYCDNLASITLPASVTSFGEEIFDCCSNIEAVYYAGTEEQWNAIDGPMGGRVMHYQHIHDYSQTLPVAKDATCTQPACIEYTCVHGDTYCEETAPALGHTYTNSCDSRCNICQEWRSIRHTYTNSCDTTCNVCGKIRTTQHKYSSVCDSACNVCKEKRNTRHEYKTQYIKATLTKNGKIAHTCQKCGYVTSGSKTIYRPKTIKLSKTSYTYNGKVKTPVVTVKDTAGKTLKKNSDYTVSYSGGRKNVGTYKVTIKFKGNYSGTKVLTFKIVPKAASINRLTAKSKGMYVNLNRQMTQSTGYEIQCATSKRFKSVKSVTTGYKTVRRAIGGLKSNTTYYVRVRTFKSVSGVKYYSGWSTVKYIKTK